jgi:hypothetical protein
MVNATLNTQNISSSDIKVNTFTNGNGMFLNDLNDYYINSSGGNLRIGSFNMTNSTTVGRSDKVTNINGFIKINDSTPPVGYVLTSNASSAYWALPTSSNWNGNATTTLDMNKLFIVNVSSIYSRDSITLAADNSIFVNTSYMFLTGSRQIALNAPTFTMATNASFNNGMFLLYDNNTNKNIINFSSQQINLITDQVDISAGIIRFRAPTQNFFSNYNTSTGTNISSAIGYIAPSIPTAIVSGGLTTTFQNVSTGNFSTNTGSPISTITIAFSGIWLISWYCNMYTSSLPTTLRLINSATNNESSFTKQVGTAYISSGTDICTCLASTMYQLAIICSSQITINGGSYKAVRIA